MFCYRGLNGEERVGSVMSGKWEKFCGQTVFKWCSGLMLVIFVPVLICVLAIGNKMDYWDHAKQTQLLFSTQVLGGIALVAAAALSGLFYLCRNICLDRKYDLIVNLILAVIFLGIYFLNVMVSRETAFKLSTDAMVVRGCAYYIGTGEPLEYYTYLSIYPNNIPISYFLGRIYRIVREWDNFPYAIDLVWIQVGCALTSIAGFFSCLTMKKLTRKLLSLAVCFVTGFFLVECSAWKMVPYTDSYAISFAVMSAYFYLLSRDSEGAFLKWRFPEGRRYLFFILSLLCAGAGGLVKPNVYIMVIAIMGIEILRPGRERKVWLYWLVDLLLVAAMMYGIGKYKEHMIGYMGLEYNKEISASGHFYFLMGLNDETTGGYNIEDSAIFGEFQFEKRAVRNKAELERAFERLREKGFPGAPYFYLRKLVMTFNDAMFGWGGVWVESYYEGDSVLASGTDRTEILRSIYWNGRWTGAYYTVCQLIWYVTIIGLPGICLVKKRNIGYDLLLLISLGLIFYQILFEASAKYLFVFLPLLIVASMCGYEQYVELAKGFGTVPK